MTHKDILTARKRGKENLIRALIYLSEWPCGLGSEAVTKVVADFNQAYDGGYLASNTKAIPNFMKLLRDHKKLLNL